MMTATIVPPCAFDSAMRQTGIIRRCKTQFSPNRYLLAWISTLVPVLEPLGKKGLLLDLVQLVD